MSEFDRRDHWGKEDYKLAIERLREENARLQAETVQLTVVAEANQRLAEENERLREERDKLKSALKFAGGSFDGAGKLTFNMAKWNAIHHCEQHSMIRTWQDEPAWQECNRCLVERLDKYRAALADDELSALGNLIVLIKQYPAKDPLSVTKAILKDRRDAAEATE